MRTGFLRFHNGVFFSLSCFLYEFLTGCIIGGPTGLEGNKSGDKY